MMISLICDAHGWTVTVTTSEPDGTRFEITNVDIAEKTLYSSLRPFSHYTSDSYFTRQITSYDQLRQTYCSVLRADSFISPL